MEIIPSIDIKSGQCVRLYQGDYSRKTIYSNDPISIAIRYQELGASLLHLVDLDGAATGTMDNLPLIQNIVSTLEIPIQVGGGIRSTESAERILAMGADRVVIGTAAIENPGLVKDICTKYGSSSIVISLDAKNEEVAIKGWTETTSINILDLAYNMKEIGVTRILYTDIARDGTLSEPNFQTNERLVNESGLSILASGGVTTLQHLMRLATIGVEGAILGKSLYTGDIDLKEAISCTS
jgi:phosphoribosylformimino-5-aminoimidazole carboxamide ribotide isomerase